MYSIFPPLFVPFIGLVFPFVTLGLFFKHIEREQIN